MITVEAAARQFLIACRADGLRPATIQWYRQLLKPFVGQLWNRPIQSVQASDVREYILALRARTQRYTTGETRPTIEGGLSYESLRDHVRALKRFFNWCVLEYENLERNPMDKIRMPGREQAEPKAVSLSDLRALLQACDDSPIGRRERAVLAFLCDTGCRVSGLLTLKHARLHLNSYYAVVTEKGLRSRAVPFTSYTAEALESWLRVQPPSEYIFCSIGKAPGAALTVSGMYQALKRLAKKASVTGRINPHAFRHGFAREYLINGGDLASLSQLMGHSSVSVTASFYAIFNREELAKLHAKHSPIRKLKE